MRRCGRVHQAGQCQGEHPGGIQTPVFYVVVGTSGLSEKRSGRHRCRCPRAPGAGVLACGNFALTVRIATALC